jgi:hypothetical protein
VKSLTTPRFRKLYAALPQKDQALAQKAFQLWLDDPTHRSLRFKEVDPRARMYSVRISARLRALGIRNGDQITWIWIGDHDEYERLIKQKP